ncbi:MAG: Mov34/MPN/PAD-1 family protein [Candidatus Hodarchaeales archaeon]|jgi:proteasome lid subunit RPN8/RPN11
MSKKKSKTKGSEDSTNLFEMLLRDMAFQFDPKEQTLTLKFPPSTSSEESKKENPTIKFRPEIDQDIVDIDVDEFSDLKVDSDPIRVQIHLKAYIRMALHALKYAHPKIPRTKWVEVIGLLTGHIENADTPLACLVITDAFPIGHGTDISAKIHNPQSMVRVYRESQKRNQRILGWYHSHPSYGAFMSDTDYQTQVRYQRLGSSSPLTAPVALVIDPTRISNRSHGFSIFRLKSDLKTWEEPKHEVLNCPLETLPDLISTLLPLSEGKAMFLEYDHD